MYTVLCYSTCKYGVLHTVLQIVYIIINIGTVGGRIFFNETSYDVTENTGSVRLVLVLSNPLSTTTVVQVDSIGGLATGEYLN